MTELPSNLPSNTIALDMSNNMLEDNLEVLTSSNYKQIRKLNMSNNQLNSLEVFRYSTFLFKSRTKEPNKCQNCQIWSQETTKLSILDLRQNNLSVFPSWLYSSQLQSRLYLSSNPWLCPCAQALQFTSFYQKNSDFLPDGGSLACMDMPCRLTDLSIREDCKTEKINPYVVIIGVELFLFVVLGCQFYKDWKMYKTTRQLPWISRHLPRWLHLPTDMFFKEKECSKSRRCKSTSSVAKA